MRTIPAPVRELGSGPPFSEGGGPSAPTSGEPDWRSLFERERRRAEELRRGEIGWRAKARSRRRQFEIGRDKLAAARVEVREVRRAAREALSLRAEVGRLKRLLSEAGMDSRKRSTIASLRLEVAAQRGRIGELEAELAKLRASRAVHAKARFGRKSERRERAGSDRPRGQQAGAAGHGRTPRPGLEKRAEVHNPAADERVCSDCGKPYVANGSDTSELIEVHVKAHTRVIERPRWRRGCDCAAAPPEVSAPPVARLFANTPYGTSVWARFLYERYACLRPLNRVADWLTGQGLPISAGTLADGARRLAPLFEPLSAAILARQREARLRRGDETAWRIQALARPAGRRDGLAHPGARRGRRVESRLAVDRGLRGRGLLPCRSLARRRGGGEAVRRRRRRARSWCATWYSAHKKLAKDSAGPCPLAHSVWAHVRGDFIKCAAGNEALADWERRWTGRIARLYRLNGARLEQHDAGLDPDHRNPAFAAAHRELERALGQLFAAARRELDGLPDEAREGGPLRSLLNHRAGLSVFLDKPGVPMDNNRSERPPRGAAIGRRLSFGSDSEAGARFTATMYSAVGTLALNGVDVLRWLAAWLSACADNGGRAPGDLSPWLPWSMDAERRNELMAPG